VVALTVKSAGYVGDGAVPKVMVGAVWAEAGTTNPNVAATKVAANIAPRAHALARPENSLVVSTMFSLARYGQLFGSGGSTRM
jgi:hypothetical protein